MGSRRTEYKAAYSATPLSFVSTVDRDEATIRGYIRNQEAEDKRLEQLRLP